MAAKTMRMKTAFRTDELAWIEEANSKAMAAGVAPELLLAREILKGNIMAGSRGRPAAHDKKAVDLLDALAFISVAGTKDIAAYNSHVRFINGWAIMSDGQVSAGFPVKGVDDLDCCPQLKQLKIALSKCGKTLSITQLETGKLSIKGDVTNFKVPCLPNDKMPDLEWDDMIVLCDDSLKAAFAACGVLTDENATDVIEASVHMQAYVCSATDKKSAIQYQHSNNLPPVVLPKLFTKAVEKVKQPLTGFGWTEGRSITLHFQGGAWIKTLVYIDPWPIESVNRILDVASSAVEIPKELIEAVAVTSEFSNTDVVLLRDGVVQTHLTDETGAQYEVKFNGNNKQVSEWHFKALGPYIYTLDTTTYPDRMLFFSEKCRGVITCFVNAMEA